MIGEPGTPDARPGPAGPAGPGGGIRRVRQVQTGFERFLSLTRLLVLIPVLFLLCDAAASFIYGTDILVRSATGVLGEPAQVGGLLGIFLIVMDTFLVGATLMVAAFGFYELFIIKSPGDRYWLPGWLRMRDLEDLKARVVSMLILVAAITFVDRTVESHDEQEVLFLGLGISIIIVALTFFLWFGKRAGPAPGPDPVAVAAGGGPAGGGSGPAGGGSLPAGGGAASSATRYSAETSAETVRSAPKAALRLATAEDRTSDGAGSFGGEKSQDRPTCTAAILGVARRDDGWVPPPATVLAVAGYARVDLSEADLARSETEIRAIAVLGVVTVCVPPGTRVAESGMAVLGLRLGRGRAEASYAGHLTLSGFCILGLIRVRYEPARPEVARRQAGPHVVALPDAPASRAAGEPADL